MINLKLKLLLLMTLALFVSSVSHVHAYESSHSFSKYSKSKKSVYKANRYAQNSFRSRSDVMHEVKQRYNAKVLKISLNEKAGVYYVRVLMPNGKVRSLKVNARN